MTIVVEGDDRVLEQVSKQLHKLVDVIKINDITGSPHVDREMVIIKVSADANTRGEIMQIAQIFRASIVDYGHRNLTIECTGNQDKMNAFEEALRPFGIKELVRTGKIAMLRGAKFTNINRNKEED
ncbi:hypothetical protein N752_10605 [Desulforamulus aquiferis]|nr:hypothetical protein N752_10605 [Desulforamulus aquiferis]